MKLRNKKTGEVQECVVIPIDENGYPNEYYVFENGETLAELNENWEDYKEEQPQQRYYLMNKETGYIATFNSLDEADTFRREVDGWRFVKVY